MPGFKVSGLEGLFLRPSKRLSWQGEVGERVKAV